MKISKDQWIMILIAVIIIGIVVWLWLSKRDAEGTTVTNGGNGNGDGDGDGDGISVDLILRDTPNYMEVTPSSVAGSLRAVWRKPDGGLTGSDVPIPNFVYWVGSWYSNGLINQLQHDNAILQAEALGY